MTQRLRVFLVDNQQLLRDTLRLVLEIDGDITLVGWAHRGDEAVLATDDDQIDVVVLDVNLRGLDGLETARQLKAKRPQRAVLFLAAQATEALVKAAFDAGANGYLVKQASGAEIRAAIREVSKGGRPMSAEVATMLATNTRSTGRVPALTHAPTGTPALGARALPDLPIMPASQLAPPDQVLTPREREVLVLIAGGLTNQSIAESLTLSVKTVETHRTALMRKLGVHDVTALVRYAVRKGLIEL